MTATIQNYPFKSGLPQEFEILDMARLYRHSPEVIGRPHRVGFYSVMWFQHGSPTHLVDFNPVRIEPNTLLFLNMDTVQRFDNAVKFGGKAILFTDRFFCKTEADVKFLRGSILFNDLFSVSCIRLQTQEKLFSSLLQMMADEMENPKDTLQADILQNLLHNFLLNAERVRRRQNFTEIKKSADLDVVILFKDLLEKNFKTQKQVAFYAKEITTTDRRLNAATTKVLGKTPKEIIDDRVMLEAKRLLAHTVNSIKEIGYFLGFEEPTNFIKYFRKHQSDTPAQFREQFSAG